MHFSGLQELRGIAVVYVVLFHIGGIFPTEMFIHGGQGVLIFFCLSGFIISSRHKGDAGLRSAWIFAKKRCVRIYVPYVPVYMAFVFLLLFADKGDEVDLVSFVRNALLVQAPSDSIHPYAWSLVYEIFYYFSFCLCVLVCRVPSYIYGFIVLSLSFFDLGKDSLLFSEYNAYFAIGVLMRSALSSGLRVSRFSSYLTLSMMIILPGVVANEVVTLISVAAVLFFLIYAPLNISFVGRLGDWSYSIYLTHAIVLAVFKNVIDDRSVSMFFVVLFSVLFVGWGYYYCVERPWTRFFASRL